MLDKKQVSIYFSKFLRLLINKKSLFFVSEAILLPFIISIAFNANEVFNKYHITRTSSIMFISAALWIGLFNSVTSICNERKVIKFEYQIKGLSLPSYVAARVLTELVLCLAEAVLMIGTIVILYPHAQGNGSQIVLFWVTLFLVIFTSDMLALLISAFVKKSSQAMTAMPLVLMVQLLFSNFLQSLDEKIPFLVWISHATITRWGTTAFFRIANMNNLVPSQGHTDWQVYQKDGVGTYAYDLLAILGNWGVLIAFSALFMVATSLVLTSVRKDAR
ncbi:ABC transporter permease [uncultured Streptococcus sp.]|uniref:ABC transporter permease n=1 Tax=uncultured Streptococcus sp. TaxID=83427 RepID=UPI0028E5776D|nr:ABC transporter permease [uncultured Streptococcus sp.]